MAINRGLVLLSVYVGILCVTPPSYSQTPPSSEEIANRMSEMWRRSQFEEMRKYADTLNAEYPGYVPAFLAHCIVVGYVDSEGYEDYLRMYRRVLREIKNGGNADEKYAVFLWRLDQAVSTGEYVLQRLREDGLYPPKKPATAEERREQVSELADIEIVKIAPEILIESLAKAANAEAVLPAGSSRIRSSTQRGTNEAKQTRERDRQLNRSDTVDDRPAAIRGLVGILAGVAVAMIILAWAVRRRRHMPSKESQ